MGNIDFLIQDHNLTARELAGYKLVFLMGRAGDQRTAGIAQSIVNITEGEYISTIGIVALPFPAEGVQSAFPFSDELESFKNMVDLLIVVSNDDLLRPDIENSFIDLHDIAHHQIWLAAKTIMDVSTFTGIVCIGLDDIRSVAKNGGYGCISIGQASGENRVEKAVRMAMPATSLITPQAGLTGNLLLYIYYGYYGPKEITMQEIGEILDIFQKAVNPQM